MARQEGCQVIFDNTKWVEEQNHKDHRIPDPYYCARCFFHASAYLMMSEQDNVLPQFDDSRKEENVELLQRILDNNSLVLNPDFVSKQYGGQENSFFAPINMPSDNEAVSAAYSPDVVLFYNIYIPKRRKSQMRNTYKQMVRRAHAIVEEQFDQIGKSYAANIPNHSLNVFYNTIGTNETFKNNDYSMHDICSKHRGIICRHMNHHDEGNEEVTLQKMYEFCWKHESARVIYVHSKGSFHPSRENNVWRRYMTSAVTSQQCLEPVNDQCNVCGLLFLPTPLHWTGNMFAAKCEYVKRLYPPRNFAISKEAISQDVMMLLNRSIFQMSILEVHDSHLGIGRFANEHWIGSHPLLVPCDVSPTVNMTLWFYDRFNSSDFKFAMSPRINIDDMLELQPRYSHVLQNGLHIGAALRSNHSLRSHEFSLLSGLVFNWLKLYGTSPPSDSWVWSWFPDGAMWKAELVYKSEKAILLKTLMI